MPVNIDQWCAGIGRFHSHDPILIFKCMLTYFYNVFLSIFILKVKARDIELNSGPKKIPDSY